MPNLTPEDCLRSLVKDMKKVYSEVTLYGFLAHQEAMDHKGWLEATAMLVDIGLLTRIEFGKAVFWIKKPTVQMCYLPTD